MFFLRCHANEPFSNRAKFRFPSVTGYSAVRDFAKEIGFGWPEFIATSELISPSKGLLVNDTLKLLCSITIIGELKHDIGNSFDPVERRNEREHQVCSDFGKLFKDSVCTDFALKTNSTTFKTHKTVLAGMLECILYSQFFIAFCTPFYSPELRVFSHVHSYEYRGNGCEFRRNSRFR